MVPAYVHTVVVVLYSLEGTFTVPTRYLVYTSIYVLFCSTQYIQYSSPTVLYYGKLVGVGSLVGSGLSRCVVAGPRQSRIEARPSVPSSMCTRAEQF